MKHGLLYVSGLIVLGSVGLAAPPAAADAVGPYYANPSWDQTLPANTRFIVLSNMNSDAVLDRETGLVWEKSPTTGSGAGNDPITWDEAQVHCNNLSKGTRRGWRLPTLQELASLVDPSVAPPGPTLPVGHPFQNVQSSIYWSATTDASVTSRSFAWVEFFNSGAVSSFDKGFASEFVWCVRGGQGVDPQ